MADSSSTGAISAGAVLVGRASAQDPNTLLDQAMDRYADGEDAAFEVVFNGLSLRLTAFLRRLGAATELAQDLTQETFLRMHQARGHFVQGKSVVPWAYAIARNCYVSHARSPRARAARSAVDADQIEIAAGQESNAEATSIARQTAGTVQRALAAMTPARREAFILLRYEGLSVEAAAQVLGTTEGALKVRAFHAYEAIRAALKSDETPQPEPAKIGS